MPFYLFAANTDLDKTFLLISVSFIFSLVYDVKHIFRTSTDDYAFYIIFFHSCSCGTMLETWHDPTPRQSEFTVDDLREACIKAARRSFNLMDVMSSARFKLSDEQLRQREEQDRKFLMIALGVYTKKYSMQVIPISIKNYCYCYSSMTILAVLVNIATSILFSKWDMQFTTCLK
jgi:hypothetical protein